MTIGSVTWEPDNFDFDDELGPAPKRRKMAHKMKYKTVDEMEDGEMVTGVVYAPAAEDCIKLAWFKLQQVIPFNPLPTVIGYIVKDEGSNETC